MGELALTTATSRSGAVPGMALDRPGPRPEGLDYMPTSHMACRQDFRGTRLAVFGLGAILAVKLVWTDQHPAPNVPGPKARAVLDRLLVRQHQLYGQNRPKPEPQHISLGPRRCCRQVMLLRG